MKLIRRFSNNTTPIPSSPFPKIPRQFTILRPLESAYARYTQEVVQWSQGGPSGKMIIGGVLLGMCTGGAWMANRHRNNREIFHRRQEDIVFFMFIGAIAGFVTGMVWPLTPAILVVYPIYKTFDIYGKGRQAPLQNPRY